MSFDKMDYKKMLVPGLLVVILALLASLPNIIGVYGIVQVTNVLMYIILTVSWVIFSGSTGYLSLATAAFYGIGIYTSAILLPNTGALLPLPVVVILAGIICFIIASLIGALTLRLKGIYFAIFTFGLVELIKHVMLWYEVEFTHTRGRFVLVVNNETIFYYMLGIFVILIITAYAIKRSRYGLALRSIGEYEEAASHMGINVTLLKVITFGISAFFMGAAGAVIATRITYIDPYEAFKALFSFSPVLMAIFGGMGQFYGPILGAAIFAYLEEYLITSRISMELGTFTIKVAELYMLIFGIILVVAILFMPNGLVGLIEKLWKRISGGERKHA